jgi:RNA polymerase sigma factor (sigma-70 family)
MADDGTLIRAYARSGSEDAFAELVQRHLGLVYSTALRIVAGDEHLAKDISQSVFIDLARKAALLSNRQMLTGWLYTSACFAAAKAVRSECRRQAREQEAQIMQEEINAASPDPDWERLRPILDSAMMELKGTDREALLLRFFEERSLAELGNRLGLNENAARKRVERALERLHTLLARRGITSTGAALTLLLTHHTLAAAPAGLAASITAVSLASAGATASSGISILNLLAMIKAKTIIIGALVAAGALTPIILQHQTNARLRAELETLRSQLDAASRPDPAAEGQLDASELERLRRENADLVRLRGDIASLRTQLADAEKVKRQAPKFAKLSRADEEEAEAKALLAKSPDILMTPVHLWTNAGFATPSAALQTLNWAIANRDTNAFGNALLWDANARARAEALFAAAPESLRQKYGTIDGIIYDWWLNHSTPVAAARVLSQIDEGPNEATLLEQHVYADGRVRENTMQFERDQSGSWRQVLPPEFMPKLDAVLGNLSPAAQAGK